ncbi:hypothetical protein [Ramlibacter sp.]|uniref:hypothetical protein n=1 Tax=Ramlibacter sp. TaxID=1917967 RepID=UPI0017ABD2AC|nr:hypothetical protein [Ramlibacter sp.]MBA2675474.1 hypothetical protein [Ramlibacter sp.]
MIKHRPHHWIAVAVVIVLALLMLRDVHGQTTGSTGRDVVRKDRDRGVENRGTMRKTQRAIKRSVQRHGVSPVDAAF